MKSLFLRIFLSFWVAQALIIVAAVLLTLALRPRAGTWEALRTATMNDAVAAYEHGGERALRKYMDEREEPQPRAATRQLAAGDLTARSGAPANQRSEKMAALMRDFDAMAERLEILVKAQSRLLNDISHELRSPLARLNVALGLARQRANVESSEMLDRIELEGARLNEVIGRILTLARLGDGEQKVPQTPVSLDDIVLMVAEDAEFEAQARHCHVGPVISGGGGGGRG